MPAALTEKQINHHIFMVEIRKILYYLKKILMQNVLVQKYVDIRTPVYFCRLVPPRRKKS